MSFVLPKPIQKYKIHLVILAVLLIVFGVLSFTYFNNDTKFKDRKNSGLQKETKKQTFSPNGPLYSIVGTITKIEKEESGGPEASGGSGVVYLKWDFDESKIFQILVSRGTIVTLQTKDSQNNIPNKAYRWYQVLKEGDRVSLNTTIDLRKSLTVVDSAISSIGIFELNEK